MASLELMDAILAVLALLILAGGAFVLLSSMFDIGGRL